MDVSLTPELLPDPSSPTPAGRNRQTGRRLRFEDVDGFSPSKRPRTNLPPVSAGPPIAETHTGTGRSGDVARSTEMAGSGFLDDSEDCKSNAQ